MNVRVYRFVGGPWAGRKEAVGLDAATAGVYVVSRLEDRSDWTWTDEVWEGPIFPNLRTGRYRQLVPNDRHVYWEGWQE